MCSENGHFRRKGGALRKWAGREAGRSWLLPKARSFPCVIHPNFSRRSALAHSGNRLMRHDLGRAIFYPVSFSGIADPAGRRHSVGNSAWAISRLMRAYHEMAPSRTYESMITSCQFRVEVSYYRINFDHHSQIDLFKREKSVARKTSQPTKRREFPRGCFRSARVLNRWIAECFGLDSMLRKFRRWESNAKARVESRHSARGIQSFS